MATTPEPQSVLTPAPNVSTLDIIARRIFHHVMDSYGISVMHRQSYDRPEVLKDWDGEGRHAIYWSFEIPNETWIYRIGDLTFAGYWLEPHNSHVVMVHKE